MGRLHASMHQAFLSNTQTTGWFDVAQRSTWHVEFFGLREVKTTTKKCCSLHPIGPLGLAPQDKTDNTKPGERRFPLRSLPRCGNGSIGTI